MDLCSGGWNKLFSVAVLSLDGKQHYPLNCSVPHECFVESSKGWGAARVNVMHRASCDLVVMINGDVQVKPELWNYVSKLKPGSFLMCREGEHVSSRIFAIHFSDYIKTGGFDPEIKYVFEDGDFYLRALNAGLKPMIIPSSLYSHVEHRHIVFDSRKAWKFDFEYCRMLVKYKRHVRRNLVWFFFQPFSLKRLPNMAFRVFATIYWLFRFRRN